MEFDLPKAEVADVPPHFAHHLTRPLIAECNLRWFVVVVQHFHLAQCNQASATAHCPAGRPLLG